MITKANIKNNYISVAIVALCLIFSFLAGTPVYGSSISSQEAILIDADTGQIIYGKSPYTLTSSGSFDKLLSIITALTYSKTPESVTATTAAINVNTDAPSLGLESGDTISVEDLYYAMYLGDYNDCANVLAVAIGETLIDTTTDEYILLSDKEKTDACIDAYVKLMNKVSDSLPCYSLKATNADGHYYDTQQGSALDIARLIQKACENKSFYSIFLTNSYNINAESGKINNENQNEVDAWVDPSTIDNDINYDESSTSRDRETLDTITLENSCDFLNGNRQYTGIQGGMITYNPSTELYHCAVMAEQNSRRLIAVVLNGEQYGVYDDIESLLDYGFYNWYKAEITNSKLSDCLPDKIADRDIAFCGQEYVLLPENVKVSDLAVSVSYNQRNYLSGTISFSLSGDNNSAGTIATYTFYEKNEKSIWGTVIKIALLIILLAVVVLLLIKAIRNIIKQRQQPLRKNRRGNRDRRNEYNRNHTGGRHNRGNRNNHRNNHRNNYSNNHNRNHTNTY